MNLLETVKSILTNGLSKGLITPTQSADVLNKLQEFLSKHPDYVPRTSRERAHTARKKVTDEDEIWSSIQPILDRAQGMDKAQLSSEHER